MGVLDGVLIIEEKRAVLGVNLGRSIATKADGDALSPNLSYLLSYRRYQDSLIPSLAHLLNEIGFIWGSLSDVWMGA